MQALLKTAVATRQASALGRRLLLLGIALCCLSSCGKTEQVKVLRMGHTLDQQHVVHLAMEKMAQKLDEYSHGRMQLRIYSGGQLGSERELIELLQIGSLALTKVSAAPLEGFAPRMQLFSVPYVFRDEQHLWQVLQGDIGQQLLDDLSQVRLKGLGYYDAGSRSFYSTQKKIETPADLPGLKFRVPNSQTAVQMVQTLGGAATPVDWGELYTALQQGVVDGAENNPPSFFLSRHYELCKYYLLDEHTSVPDLMLMSQHVWDRLTPEEQGWVQQAFADSQQWQREAWRAQTIDALNKVKAAGVTVIVPDKTPFIQAVQPLHQRLVGTAVGDLIKQIAAMPKQSGAEQPSLVEPTAKPTAAQSGAQHE